MLQFSQFSGFRHSTLLGRQCRVSHDAWLDASHIGGVMLRGFAARRARGIRGCRMSNGARRRLIAWRCSWSPAGPASSDPTWPGHFSSADMTSGCWTTSPPACGPMFRPDRVRRGRCTGPGDGRGGDGRMRVRPAPGCGRVGPAIHRRAPDGARRQHQRNLQRPAGRPGRRCPPRGLRRVLGGLRQLPGTAQSRTCPPTRAPRTRCRNRPANPLPPLHRAVWAADRRDPVFQRLRPRQNPSSPYSGCSRCSSRRHWPGGRDDLRRRGTDQGLHLRR